MWLLTNFRSSLNKINRTVAFVGRSVGHNDVEYSRKSYTQFITSGDLTQVLCHVYALGSGGRLDPTTFCRTLKN